MLQRTLEMVHSSDYEKLSRGTVQDDLLARVLFDKFACRKLMVNFILAILCHVPLSMLMQFETKWWILYWLYISS